ncbi:hypothetical protein A5659_26500 [Mycobacterium sp. 1165196.3]|uniref:hypothetical protein n=1 Tax=Mycobacterium sp. 1165196.3 TaxID=1834071 RepID=UPI0007FD2593|nr:hypothetical protein [Mycobacterium sp. 1165196.3]OBK31032.1 hypothetical protein A5659_26500 [Mycobacterium sp. 1165196.3]
MTSSETTAAATPIDQIRTLAFHNESIGMGFNSHTGQAVGTALQGFTVGADPAASGQEVTAEITIVNSQEELMDKMSMSFSLQGRYEFFSASAKASFSEQTNINSTSTFLLARCVVKNPLTRGQNFVVKPDAAALLNTSEGEDTFTRAFGDSFVRGLQTGGEFYAVIRITSQSTVTQTNLATSLNAAADMLVASADFKAQFNTANTSAATRSEYTATMYQRAGSGETISPTVTIDEIAARYHQFPQIAKDNPVAFETEVATYDTLPLPLPTPEERDDFRAALADARDHKMRYIQSRNDADFARTNPQFFTGLPPNAVLAAASASYTALINAVIDHAVRLSKGQFDSPQFFDPQKCTPPLTEPQPIVFTRAPAPPAPVTPPGPGWKTSTIDTKGAMFPVDAYVSPNGVGVDNQGRMTVLPVNGQALSTVSGASFHPGGFANQITELDATDDGLLAVDVNGALTVVWAPRGQSPNQIAQLGGGGFAPGGHVTRPFVSVCLTVNADGVLKVIWLPAAQPFGQATIQAVAGAKFVAGQAMTMPMEVAAGTLSTLAIDANGTLMEVVISETPAPPSVRPVVGAPAFPPGARISKPTVFDVQTAFCVDTQGRLTGIFRAPNQGWATQPVTPPGAYAQGAFISDLAGVTFRPPGAPQPVLAPLRSAFAVNAAGALTVISMRAKTEFDSPRIDVLAGASFPTTARPVAALASNNSEVVGFAVDNDGRVMQYTFSGQTQSWELSPISEALFPPGGAVSDHFGFPNQCVVIDKDGLAHVIAFQ